MNFEDTEVGTELPAARYELSREDLRAYAEAFLGQTASPFGPVAGLGADALTANPYMGAYTLAPMLEVARPHGRGLFVLVRTSNPGADDVEDLPTAPDGEPVWARVARMVAGLGEGALVSLLAIAAHFRGTVQEAHAPVALLFATVGGVLLVSSLDLGLIVLFLQMLSMGSYILVSLVRRDRRANEATLKFFIYAAVALAVMAYGLSFLFGLTGSLELRAIGRALAGADPVWVAVAFGLVVIGYAFEVTVVPFHFWAPDVYDGATAPVAGFLSVVPKIAGFGALLRFLLVALPDGLAAWPLVIAVLAALTMTLGNLAALRQTHLKRLLAYSSIAQAGYVLMVVAVAGRADSALSAAGFYLAAYLFMNLGAFVVTAQLERLTGSDRVAGLRGLGQRAPFAAAVFTLSLLSLAGIPPLAGFAGKVLLLEATLAGGLTWLAVVGAVNMAVSLYYYLMPVAEMYLKPTATTDQLPTWAGYRAALALSLLGTLALGVAPGPALALTGQLARLLGG